MDTITVKCTVNAPVDRVWTLWTNPNHIIKWYNASDDWHTPEASNEMKEGGKFNFRMEAKDGSSGFDFEGVYDMIKLNKFIEYTIADGRKVRITFDDKGNKTFISETFELENENSSELQREGWQNILDNFKKYAEASM